MDKIHDRKLLRRSNSVPTFSSVSRYWYDILLDLTANWILWCLYYLKVDIGFIHQIDLTCALQRQNFEMFQNESNWLHLEVNFLFNMLRLSHGRFEIFSQDRLLKEEIPSGNKTSAPISPSGKVIISMRPNTEDRMCLTIAKSLRSCLGWCRS